MSTRLSLPARAPVVTLALCGLAVAVQLGSGWHGAPANAPGWSAGGEQLHLTALGAKATALVLDTGEWWRLVTCHFVHTGWVHLGFNLAFLFPVAGALELVTRRDDFAALVGASLACSGLASLLWTRALSCGISGLVFASLAAALMFGLRHRARLGMASRRHFGPWVAPFLIAVIAAGAGNPYVDHASHLAGLAAGLVFGAALRPPDVDLRPRGVQSGPMWAATVVVAVALGGGPTLARGGGRAVERRVGEAALRVPRSWSVGTSALGEAELRGAAGLVRLTVERRPRATPGDERRWYVERRVVPLQRAGELTGLRVVERGRLGEAAQLLGAGRRGHTLRLRYDRAWGAAVRDVAFVGEAGESAWIVALELPAAWAGKYGPTFAAAVATVRPLAAQGPGRSVPAALAASPVPLSAP